MSNRLKMAKIHSIQLLHSMGWSQRRIDRELGIDRETVRKYLACGLEEAKSAIPPTGSDGSKPATFAGVPAPVAEEIGPGGCRGIEGDAKPAIPPTDSEAAESPHRAGRQSECERLRGVILEMLERNPTAQRIYQDLVAEHGFEAGYDSVKRFVRNLSSLLLKVSRGAHVESKPRPCSPQDRKPG
jgi:hypothetical protein